jgi:hypothetical protein
MSSRDHKLLTDSVLRGLDDAALEILRRSTLRESDDERYELILRRLIVRGVPAIELVCREEGQRRGLHRAQIGLAIEDACARLLLRLHRLDELPSVSAMAAELARDCVAAQQPLSTTSMPLVDEQPRLRLVRRDGNPFSPNDWRTS